MRHRTRLARLLAPALVAAGVVTATAVAPGPAAAAPDGAWDPTLPAVVSAGAPGDPVAIANASLQATAQATQTTMDLGRKFLGGLGFNVGGNADPATANTSPSAIPRVYGRQAVEYVIRRGMSQLGVPYSWGGGKPNGPSAGVESDAGKIGFDCSGFTRFAFAGVGVLIPKYSGDQYNTGRHVSPSAAKRGDLIFYGPGGSQHVALYLGNNQMLEASGSAGKVTVSPVRTAGMTQYLSRIIEY